MNDETELFKKLLEELIKSKKTDLDLYKSKIESLNLELKVLENIRSELNQRSSNNKTDKRQYIKEFILNEAEILKSNKDFENHNETEIIEFDSLIDNNKEIQVEVIKPINQNNERIRRKKGLIERIAVALKFLFGNQ